MESADQIQVGRHGVVIRRGSKQAVYLPQVAPEQGWDREEMLENLCLKAGLYKDDWKKEGTQFYVFTAEVFTEGDPATISDVKTLHLLTLFQPSDIITLNIRDDPGWKEARRGLSLESPLAKKEYR